MGSRKYQPKNMESFPWLWDEVRIWEFVAGKARRGWVWPDRASLLSQVQSELEPGVGIEPTTSSLQEKCSAD